MPDFLTHALFAQDLLDSADFPGRAACRAHANLFRLGAQGADLFFYVEFTAPGHRYARIGSALHEKLFPAEIQTRLAALAADDPQRAQKQAYLLGVLTHLCLDGFAHPFIERRAGELAAASQGRLSENCAHVRLESCYEAKEYRERTGLAPKAYPVRGDLARGADEATLVAGLWAELLPAVLGETLSAPALARAILRLPALFTVLFDRRDVCKHVLDFFVRFSPRDNSLRWHIKRPYDPTNTTLDPADAREIERLCRAAAAEFPALAQ